MRYAFAIFDIDGTIVISNDAHAHAWVQALASHGTHVEFDDVRKRIGMGGDQLLKEIAGIDIDSSEGRQISRERRAIFVADYLPQLQPTRGARRLIEWLRSKHVGIAIATSAKAEEVNGLLKAAGVDDLVDRVASSDDAEESKPDPDIVLAALRKSGCSSDRAIMLGDTPYDIQAAAAARVPVVAFRTGGWSDSSLAGAVAIFDDPEDLLQNQATSTFASEDGTF